ncbi:MAG: hypothetical protein CMJ15_10270 [Pelagibacterium sp.]|nr:hypothetical protein [Pelagibacterium sp.]
MRLKGHAVYSRFRWNGLIRVLVGDSQFDLMFITLISDRACIQADHCAAFRAKWKGCRATLRLLVVVTSEKLKIKGR